MPKHTPDCTCSCDPSFGNTRVDFCPLHKTAPDLLAALENLTKALKNYANGHGQSYAPEWLKALAAIAKARNQ